MSTMINARKAMDKLFVSRVRIKLLHYFLMNKDIPVHLRGAVRELSEEINAVRRELTRLEEIKLIKSETRGNRKYYTLNREGPFIDELTGIVYKTYGLGGDIVRNLNKLGPISFAILTGSYVNNVVTNSQHVDLVIIGEVDMHELNKIIEENEQKEEREINYTVFKPSEFELRKKRRDSFLMDLFIEDKVMLVGSYGDLVS